MDFKFLHAADIHLDSPLRGLSRYEGVPVETVRTATRTALDNLVDLAITEKVAFVIIAGDLYDGTWEAFATGLYFCKAMGRLERAQTDVFLIYGNHDAESHLTKQLPLPPNVRVFSAKAAESLVHVPTETVLHGQSYLTRDPGGDLAEGYPTARDGLLNIGVLHTALTGDRGHAPYAPCTPDQLTAKGYDYWALGHVHSFEIVRREPYIVFPGNLQGRNIRETGPKGAAMVTVAEGRIKAVDHLPLDVVRWALAEVDVSTAASIDDVRDIVRRALQTVQVGAEGRPLMVRVRLGGSTPFHATLAEGRAELREAVRAIATTLSDEIWVEKVVLATTEPVSAEPLNDEFDAVLAALVEEPEIEAGLAEDLRDFLTRVPVDPEGDAPAVTAARSGDLAAILRDAAASARVRVQGGASL
mgnify:CR=1 FL=1